MTMLPASQGGCPRRAPGAQQACTSGTHGSGQAAKLNKRVRWKKFFGPLLCSPAKLIILATYDGQNPLLASLSLVGGVRRWRIGVGPSDTPAGCTYTPLPNATGMQPCSK